MFNLSNSKQFIWCRWTILRMQMSNGSRKQRKRATSKSSFKVKVKGVTVSSARVKEQVKVIKKYSKCHFKFTSASVCSMVTFFLSMKMCFSHSINMKKCTVQIEQKFSPNIKRYKGGPCVIDNSRVRERVKSYKCYWKAFLLHKLNFNLPIGANWAAQGVNCKDELHTKL